MNELLTLVAVCIVLLGSPGPATLSLAAVGATQGFRGGLPFLAGILSGLIACITAAAFGIAIIFEQWPALAIAVQAVGALYLLWIAYRIATTDLGADASVSRPLNFKDGLILNLLNPKAYAAFFAIFSQFLLSLDPAWWAYIVTGGACFITGVAIDLGWLAIGGGIRTVLRNEKTALVVRLTFAVSIVIATALAMLAALSS